MCIVALNLQLANICSVSEFCEDLIYISEPSRLQIKCNNLQTIILQGGPHEIVCKNNVYSDSTQEGSRKKEEEKNYRNHIY